MAASEHGSGGRFEQWARAGPSADVRRYVVAIGALAAALLFRYLVRDSLGLKVPYLQFYPAIIVAAWYGGLGPGVLATALSALAAMYFFLPPAGLPSVIPPTAVARWCSSRPGS